MSGFKNWEVLYKDKTGELRVTFFRGTDLFSILPYLTKFKEEMVDIIYIRDSSVEF